MHVYTIIHVVQCTVEEYTAVDKIPTLRERLVIKMVVKSPPFSRTMVGSDRYIL